MGVGLAHEEEAVGRLRIAHLGVSGPGLEACITQSHQQHIVIGVAHNVHRMLGLQLVVGAVHGHVVQLAVPIAEEHAPPVASLTPVGGQCEVLLLIDGDAVPAVVKSRRQILEARIQIGNVEIRVLQIAGQLQSRWRLVGLRSAVELRAALREHGVWVKKSGNSRDLIWTSGKGGRKGACFTALPDG